MITKQLNKIIALGIVDVLLLAFNPIGSSARVSENEAKDLNSLFTQIAEEV